MTSLDDISLLNGDECVSGLLINVLLCEFVADGSKKMQVYCIG